MGIFDHVDANGSGFIDHDEFIAAVAQMGDDVPAPVRLDPHGIFTEYAGDDAQMDFGEFATLVHDVMAHRDDAAPLEAH